jgi:hypothetical protein
MEGKMKITRTRRFILTILASALMLAGGGPPSPAAEDPIVNFGPSDALSVEVYGGLYKNSFWWDHSNLTVAVSAAPDVDPLLKKAIHDAIETWRTLLADRLPIVSLTDITLTSKNPQRADIVIHYVPHAGGIAFSGRANCGVQKCPSVIVRSDVPEHNDAAESDYDEARVYKTALHEMGHALGLGHASPLNESLDLMAYGWIYADPDLTPVLSDCDMDGIAAAFEWAIRGENPHPASVPFVVCR